MFMNRIFNLLKFSAISFYRNGNFTYASSIAFYFLFSIIPFVSLTILIVNYLQAYLDVNYIELLTPYIINLFPFIPQDKIASLIDIQSTSSINVFALLILPIISGFIFSVMDNAYRKIFGLKTRHLIFSQMIYPVISVSIILLLFIANIFFSILSTYTNLIIENFPNLNIIWNYIPSVNSHFISTIIFLFFYILLINLFVGLHYKIKFKNKLIAAALFYGLWFIAKQAFTYYLKINTNISLIYGPFTSIVIILLWIYYSSIVLLFTLEILHYLHKKDTHIKGLE